MSLWSPLEGATVLVVEQEPRVRAAVTETLNGSGCVVVEADSPQVALSALEERSDVQVMVADIDMADAHDGLAFAHQVHQRCQRAPKSPRLWATNIPELAGSAVTGDQPLV